MDEEDRPISVPIVPPHAEPAAAQPISITPPDRPQEDGVSFSDYIKPPDGTEGPPPVSVVPPAPPVEAPPPGPPDEPPIDLGSIAEVSPDLALPAEIADGSNDPGTAPAPSAAPPLSPDQPGSGLDTPMPRGSVKGRGKIFEQIGCAGIIVLLLVLVIGGGAGAYLLGAFDPPAGTPTPSASPSGATPASPASRTDRIALPGIPRAGHRG